MGAAYVEPRVTVRAVDHRGGVLRVTVSREPRLGRPFAPASLCSDADPATTLLRLHRLVALTADAATFESDEEVSPGVAVGDVAVFRPWWTPDQLELAQDRARAWTPRQFAPRDALLFYRDGTASTVPGGWDHEHCELCRGKIDTGTVGAYCDSDTDDWLCGPCYDAYIRTGRGASLGDRV
ncbi:MAG: hypothetical protein R3F56_01525 [Planctomycetota bacterium]